MTLEQVRKLRPGDSVYWHDPDEGLCSRVYKIGTIEIINDDYEDDAFISISEPFGSEFECYPWELEKVLA